MVPHHVHSQGLGAILVLSPFGPAEQFARLLTSLTRGRLAATSRGIVSYGVPTVVFTFPAILVRGSILGVTHDSPSIEGNSSVRTCSAGRRSGHLP